MSLNNSITCDCCGGELITNTSTPHKWTLELRAIDTNVNTTGLQYCVHLPSPIPEPLHFCNKKCLSEWLEK